jgi:hypothetical protein
MAHTRKAIAWKISGLHFIRLNAMASAFMPRPFIQAHFNSDPLVSQVDKHSRGKFIGLNSK